MVSYIKWQSVSFFFLFTALIYLIYVLHFVFQPEMHNKLIWPKIYFLGDSLTQFAFSVNGGWGSIIANEFQRKADIIGRGFSGYNSRQCRALLPFLEDDLKGVTIAGVFLGANDANDPAINTQGVPLKEYKENLKNITNFMKESGVKSIFLITPPALDEEVWQKVCNGNEVICAKTAQMVSRYAEACAETAKELGLPYVDIHTAMLQQKNWKGFLSDGLHFSEKGSEFVASQILSSLEVLWNKLDVIHGADQIMPSYNDIRLTNPEESFKQWMEKYQ